jgi:hypothetical protein
MFRIRNIKDYPVSTNYEKLWELAQKQGVICIVDYDRINSWLVRDVCSTIFSQHNYEVSARGIAYISAETKEEFLEQCKKRCLVWVLPAKLCEDCYQNETCYTRFITEGNVVKCKTYKKGAK